MSESCRSENKPIIGLSGGIGAGKSVVASILKEFGVGVVDSDRIGRVVLDDPGVLSVLRDWWGDSILDSTGGVDRERVGDIVFADSRERSRLERLLHPLIARERASLVRQYQADPAVSAVVFDSPLLFETGLSQECDVVWFVAADRAVRTRRVASSRSWTENELDRREKLQKALDYKQASADDMIINNSDIDDLREHVARLLHQLLERTPHEKPRQS
ncbi:MAG: dephospho-CoA kinase [bacterium]|nr:dephospho-CoA kinase [bacterium]